MKAFLFANVPLSMLHFILFLIFKGFLGQPGFAVADALGASNGGILWWGRQSDVDLLLRKLLK